VVADLARSGNDIGAGILLLDGLSESFLDGSSLLDLGDESLNLNIGHREGALLSPVLLIESEIVLRSEFSLGIAETLFLSTWEWISSSEGIRTARNLTSKVIIDGKTELHGVINADLGGFIIISIKLGEIDVTRTEELVALISASDSIYLIFHLAVALFLSSWHGVSIEISGRALNPTIADFSKSSPLSHFFESFDLHFVVWTIGESEPSCTWAVATLGS